MTVSQSVDIQWGNHDVLWMGAAAGQRGCIANVIRICARYGNLDILEDGYGINLLPLGDICTVYSMQMTPAPALALKGSDPASDGAGRWRWRSKDAQSDLHYPV